MEDKEIFEHISSDPDILYGKPCIKGTRIPVYLIVSLIAEDVSTEEIIKDYPSLTPEDIKAQLNTPQNYVNTRLMLYEIKFLLDENIPYALIDLPLQNSHIKTVRKVARKLLEPRKQSGGLQL